MAMGPRKRVRPRLWGQGLVFDMRELIAFLRLSYVCTPRFGWKWLRIQRHPRRWVRWYSPETEERDKSVRLRNIQVHPLQAA